MLGWMYVVGAVGMLVFCLTAYAKVGGYSRTESLAASVMGALMWPLVVPGFGFYLLTVRRLERKHGVKYVDGEFQREGDSGHTND